MRYEPLKDNGERRLQTSRLTSVPDDEADKLLYTKSGATEFNAIALFIFAVLLLLLLLAAAAADSSLLQERDEKRECTKYLFSVHNFTYGMGKKRSVACK